MNLQELQEKLAGREALEEELELLHQKGNELNERLRREKLNLEYEQSDVEALESNTLKSFFYTAIGKKEERLMKEEDEAEEAKEQYEGTLKELEQVNARIKRIEIELRNLKWAERDYKKLVEDLSARVKELAPKMTNVDAIALESIQKELAEQNRNQAYYTELIEEGEKLIFYIQLVRDSLQEMLDEDRMGTVFGEYAAEKEAKERRKLVEMQAQRLKDCLAKGVQFTNDYSIDMQSIDNMISRTIIACNDNNNTSAYLMLPDAPDLVLNLQGMLNELKQKIERSGHFQSELESRLSELIEKYQTT